MKKILRFFTSENIGGRSWDPNSIFGLGDWNANYRETGMPTKKKKSTRGRPNNTVPLATRLKEVTAKFEELEKFTPDLNELKS